MLRITQSNNSQLLNLTVFYTFLTYLCKCSPCCVSTVVLVSASFAVTFAQNILLYKAANQICCIYY